jgi:hypothetical protein
MGLFLGFAGRENRGKEDEDVIFFFPPYPLIRDPV